SDPLAPDSVSSIEGRFKVRSWALERSATYGSKHHDEKAHEVTGAELSEDGLVLKLSILGMAPVWQMSIAYELIGAGGEPVIGEIQNTIHRLAPAE
ncbi:MAG: hypothetical protein ACC661_04415, partial [Verrucomicrobiales bacterium]